MDYRICLRGSSLVVRGIYDSICSSTDGKAAYGETKEHLKIKNSSLFFSGLISFGRRMTEACIGHHTLRPRLVPRIRGRTR